MNTNPSLTSDNRYYPYTVLAIHWLLGGIPKKDKQENSVPFIDLIEIGE